MMRNEANLGQGLAGGIRVLLQARDLLWQIAEEDGDAERNPERWNKGGDGYTLVQRIATVLPSCEALRDEWLRLEQKGGRQQRNAAQGLAFSREVVRVLEGLLRVAESEEINTPADMRSHLRYVQRSRQRGEALLARARQHIAEMEAHQ